MGFGQILGRKVGKRLAQQTVRSTYSAYPWTPTYSRPSNRGKKNTKIKCDVDTCGWGNVSSTESTRNPGVPYGPDFMKDSLFAADDVPDPEKDYLGYCDYYGLVPDWDNPNW